MGNDVAASAADQRGVIRPQGTASDIGAFELEPEPTNINDSLSLDGLDTDYDPADPRAPAGVFTVTTTFANTSADSLSDVFFEVTTLTGGNTVLNADEGDGGVGSTVNAGDLSPGESFDVVFEIGLVVRAAFEFFVDAFGVID